MSDRASSKELDELHRLVASSLAAKIRSGEFTAAELNVARQFLKDNGIEAVVTPGSPLQALTDTLPFAGSPSH